MTVAAAKKLIFALPPSQRLKFADALVDSIPPMRKPVTLAELEKRIDDVESGRVKPISGKRFLAELEEMEQSIGHKRLRQRG